MKISAKELGSEALLEAFEFLDELRESGRTNMFGAPAYLQDEMDWARNEAIAAAQCWMETFSADPVADRVDRALLAVAPETRP